MRIVVIDEETHANPGASQLLNDWLQAASASLQVPPAVRCQLSCFVRDQRALVRKAPLDHGKKLIDRISLHIEFSPRVLPGDPPKIRHIRIAGMALVGPGVE